MRAAHRILLGACALLQPGLASAADALFEASVKAEVEYAAAEKVVQEELSKTKEPWKALLDPLVPPQGGAPLVEWCKNQAKPPKSCEPLLASYAEGALKEIEKAWPIALGNLDSTKAEHQKALSDACAIKPDDVACKALLKDLADVESGSVAPRTVPDTTLWGNAVAALKAEPQTPDWFDGACPKAQAECVAAGRVLTNRKAAWNALKKSLAEPTADVEPLLAWCQAEERKASADCKAILTLGDAVANLEKARSARNTALEAYGASVANNTSLAARIAGSRRARCVTAYCWGGVTGDKYAFEPILELPIGLTWAVGNNTLSNHINSAGLDVRFNAGIRYWFQYDWASIGVLFFEPTLTSPRSVEFPSISEPLGSDAIRRPYPTLVLGIAADLILLTLSYDTLRNVTASGDHDPNYLPNEILARTYTFGLYLAPLTAARNGIGASSGGR